MKVIMKNNFRRLLEQKQIIVLLVLFTAAASCAAVFVSTGMTQKWDVAVVSPTSAGIGIEAGKYHTDGGSPAPVRSL